MKKNKTKKIPRYFRKALKEKRIRSISRMLTDSSERELFLSSFPAEEDGKCRYRKPGNRKSEEKIAGILKKLRKARTGPRSIRLGVLSLLILLPVLFNLIFLDRMAAGFLEEKLEKISGTDVTVSNLDIQALKGRFLLGKLAFASERDSRTDSWVFEHLKSDISWTSLFYRRLLIDELSAGILRDVPRDTEAVYPRDSREEGAEAEKGESSGTRFQIPDFNSLSGELIPDETLQLLENLKVSAEEDQKYWETRIEKDSEDISRLSGEISSFLEKPLPGKSDIQGWTSRIEEGRRLSAEVSSERNLIDDYSSDLDAAVRETRKALERGRAAVDADLNKVKGNFSVTGLDKWAETLIISAAGPKAGRYYRKISDLVLRLRASGSGGADREKKETETTGKRINRGRIVPFPVALPPRFSIRTLELDGAGIRVNGRNIGIDHDLAGSPSELEVDWENRVSAELCIDGRTGAEKLVEGNARVKGFEWPAGEDIPGGIIGSDFSFSVESFTEEADGVEVQGQAVLSGWTSVNGPLSFISSSSPPLSFFFSYAYEDGESDVNIRIDSESLDSWKDVIQHYLISEGGNKASEMLPPEAAENIEALETVLENWDENENLLSGLSGVLDSRQSELDSMIDEWTKGASANLPVPKAADLLKGAGSLFGN
jgi:hypothetical protein